MSTAAEWPVIGIDFGMAYSCVAIWKKDDVEIIPNENCGRRTPSWVAFTSDNERLIGEAAFHQATRNPNNTIFGVNRLIGRRFSDKKVQEFIKIVPFKVIGKLCDNGEKEPFIAVTCNGEEKHFSPEEISAMILSKMKGIAEDFLGSVVKNAIITVPTYFNDSQRLATRNAGVIAGLNVIRLLSEPIAAALAYGLDKTITNLHHEKNVLVFDLGREIFDVSLVCIKKNKWVLKASSSDTDPVGAYFNSRLVNYFAEEFKRKHKVDISQSPKSLGRLRVACERVVNHLLDRTEVAFEIDCLYNSIDFSSILLRSTFENLNEDLFNKYMERSHVDEVVLVGESTRIPKIQQLLEDFFGGKKLRKSINPNEVVARGAAIHGAILPGLDVFVHPLIPSQDEVNKLENVDALEEAANDIVMVKRKQVEKGKKQVERAEKYDEAAKEETEAIRIEIDQKIASNNKFWEKKIRNEIDMKIESINKFWEQKIRNEIDQKIASTNKFWEHKFVEVQKAYEASSSNKDFICICDKGRIHESILWPKFSDHSNNLH